MARAKEKENIQNDTGEARIAFTIEKDNEGWALVKITYKNDKIVSISRSEPDMKALTIEKFKIAAFKYWSSIG